MYAAILFLISSLPEKHNFIFLMLGGGGGGNKYIQAQLY